MINSKSTTLIDEFSTNEGAKAEIIDNNIKHEIVKKADMNPKYYGKLSEMLEDIIEQRKIEAISYEEYLKQVVELAKAVLHPENNGDYPDEIRASEAKRALYDYFDEDVDKAVNMDRAIRSSLSTNWKDNLQKQKKIKLAIYNNLSLYSHDEEKISDEVEEIFSVMERQDEYGM